MLVVIMHSGSAYIRMVTSAILVGLCHVSIGAILMVVFMFSLQNEYFKDKHVPFYVFGFHFFCAEAILFLNYANGMSTPMRMNHRRIAHGSLQVCAMCFIVAGTIMVYVQRGASGSPHGLTGIVAATLAGCTLLSFPLALYGEGQMKYVHVVLGIPAFAMSSISLCLGLNTKYFTSWSGPPMVPFFSACVIFYTVVIIITVVFKCWPRRNN